MFMLTLEKRGEPVAFNPSAMEFGGRISVIRDDGCWDLALFGCAEGCKNLTRAIYVMEDDETPTDEEVVDALGELVNTSLRTPWRRQAAMTLSVPTTLGAW